MGAPVGSRNGAKQRKFYDQMMVASAANDYAKLRNIAEKTLALAEEGEQWAVEFVRDTLDGKPSSSDSNATNLIATGSLTLLSFGTADGDSAGSNLLTLPAREVQSPLRWAGVGQVVGDSESVAGDSVQQSGEDTVRARDPADDR